MISATEISTKQSHINAFQNFLVHSKSSVEDDILDLNYADLPGVNPNSTGFDLFESTHGGYDVLQGALLSYLASNYNIFADRMFDVVQVKFSNGDTAVFAIDSDSRGALRSIVNIPILFVTDENGNVTHVFASNDTEVVQQSGTGGSYFLIVRVGGTKYCYGNCGNKGTVKIIEVTEE